MALDMILCVLTEISIDPLWLVNFTCSAWPGILLESLVLAVCSDFPEFGWGAA